MIDPTAISINLILFIAVIVVFLKEWDYAAYSLLFAVILCVFSSFYFNTPAEEYVTYIDFSTLLFIVSSQIMIMVAEEKEIFQYIAIKALFAAKGKPRHFLYMISIISSLIAAITPDVMVSLTFIPLVIRVARILKVDPKPFMYAVTINMNIGACLAPLNPTNFIIAAAFGKSPFWFFQNMIGMYLINVLLTTYILDRIYLRKSTVQDDERKMVLEIMTTEILFTNSGERRKFLTTFVIFFATIVCFFLLPHMEVVSLVGAILLSLANRKEMEECFKKVDWKIIFFLISMFLIIGTMRLAGFFEFIGNGIGGIFSNNIFLDAVIILLITSFFSAFIDNTPVALMIIPILLHLFEINPVIATHSTPILFAFIAAANLGGNLLPQGAAGDLMTLNQAKKHNVTDFNYRSLTKVGGSFALLHILTTILLIFLFL
jgi:Na+/H+ antiporter NhaD/arsenite permease-like protein